MLLIGFTLEETMDILRWFGHRPERAWFYSLSLPPIPIALNARGARRLKRRVFRSVIDLQAAIKRFLVETNDNPELFIWRENLDQIIAAVRRGYQTLDSIH